MLETGPIGALLEENLRQEWFYSTIINRDIPVFFNNGNFEDSFLYVKEICLSKFPFGIAEILTCNNTDSFDADAHNSNEFSNKLRNVKTLSCVTFVPASRSIRFFHQLQREREMWWRIVMQQVKFNLNRLILLNSVSFQHHQTDIIYQIHVVKNLGSSWLKFMQLIRGDRNYWNV